MMRLTGVWGFSELEFEGRRALKVSAWFFQSAEDVHGWRKEKTILDVSGGLNPPGILAVSDSQLDFLEASLKTCYLLLTFFLACKGQTDLRGADEPGKGMGTNAQARCGSSEPEMEQ